MTLFVFRAGDRRLSLEAARVAGVARATRLTRVPGAPPALAGVAALEGRPVPVLSLTATPGRLWLKLTGEPAALAVDAVEGLVDAVEGLSDAEPFDLDALLARSLVQAPARAAARPAAVARPRAAEADLAFLAFVVAGQRFALPLAQTHAVLPAPALTPAPGADPVILGLAERAQGALPVVDLAALLGLTPAAAPARLVVVEIGGAPVGLAVEQVRGALRIPPQAVSPAPAVLNRGLGEARVAQIARTQEGLTLVLAPDLLFDAPTTRRLQALAAPERILERAAEARSEALLIFRLGAERYALPAACVEAVAKPPSRLNPPPGAPPFLKGAMAHRGEAFPLIDQGARFAAASGARVVVLMRAGGVAAGLMVDAVEGVVRLAAGALAAAPPIAGDAGALFARVAAAQGADGPLLVADPASLLDQARRDLLARA